MMKMQLIRDIAQDRGIKAGKMSKVNLVREIQRLEGSNTCFATDINGQCEQDQCLWHDDCSVNAKKLAS